MQKLPRSRANDGSIGFNEYGCVGIPTQGDGRTDRGWRSVTPGRDAEGKPTGGVGIDLQMVGGAGIAPVGDDAGDGVARALAVAHEFDLLGPQGQHYLHARSTSSSLVLEVLAAARVGKTC